MYSSPITSNDSFKGWGWAKPANMPKITSDYPKKHVLLNRSRQV